MRDERRDIVRSMAWLASAGLLVAALSCSGDLSEPAGPGDPDPPTNPPPTNPPPADQSAVVATEPVELQGGSASLVRWNRAFAGLASLSDEEVSYVSYPPGSQPEADSAEVVNRTRDLAVGAPMVDGGLDPIFVPASVGDTLVITTYRRATIFERVEREVPERNPPVIVRTDPPRGKTRVPLNSRILIVFSEPIAIGSATADNLQLLRDGQPVPADMTLDAERLRVELRPDVPLSPQTDYTLLIDTGVTDLSGDPLEQEAEVTFSTTEATLSITPEAVSIAVGVRLQLTPSLTNPQGGGETLPPVIWSTSDQNVATVSGAGAVTGVSPGSANIGATIEGQKATATVTVIATSNTAFAELTAGRNHTCGLTAAGVAHCWGSNEYGQLGDAAGGVGVRQIHPVPVTGGHNFSMLAAGTHHTCGLTASGTLLCWGRNDQGQLGDGSQADQDAPTPVAGSDGYFALTAGLDHTCGRSASDTYCWGRNVGDVLGDWTMSPTPRQVEPSGDLTWAPIDYMARRQASAELTCPLIITSHPEMGIQLWCFGQMPEGRMALDLATLSILNVSGSLASVIELHIDQRSTCTVTLGGGASCTRISDNSSDLDFVHENGLGVEVCAGARCSVPGFDVSYWYLEGDTSLDPQDLRIGLIVNGDVHSCGLTLDGEAYCWGGFDRGQLGRQVATGDVWGSSAVAVRGPVEGNLTFAALAAGEKHTCGVSRTGEPYCWGANGFGQLGDGTLVDRDVPVRVDFSQ